MAATFTLKQVLEKAIQREIESQLLYISLSQKVKETAAKDAFKELARQEREHQERLEQYQRGELKQGALSRGELVDYKIAEKLDQVQI